MPVGDSHGQEPGQGARFNDDKPRLEYVPWGVLVHWSGSANYDAPERATLAARSLTLWEFGCGFARDALSHAHLVDLELAAAAFEYGATKYSDWNWALGMKWSVPSACAKRHFCKAVMATGAPTGTSYTSTDPESGVTHIGHFWCNVIMLAHFEEHYPSGDDRPIAQLPGVPFSVTKAVSGFGSQVAANRSAKRAWDDQINKATDAGQSAQREHQIHKDAAASAMWRSAVALFDYQDPRN